LPTYSDRGNPVFSLNCLRVNADASDNGIRSKLLQDQEHCLERSVVTVITAAEQPKQADLFRFVFRLSICHAAAPGG
jgi:hypothetical protein